MKKILCSFALIGLMTACARGELILSTDHPAGSPLIMDAGSTSGPMLVSVSSDNPPLDVMAAWQFQLEIVADPGATGSLTFLTPATGLVPDPSDYVFGGNGLGIVATNSGTSLDMNDFFDPAAGPGSIVPGTPGANLAELTFSATADASGLFGIYAVRDLASTLWTDDSFATRYFSNVPQGTDFVRIGEVRVVASVPEPSSLSMLGMSLLSLIGWEWKRRRAERTIDHGRSEP